MIDRAQAVIDVTARRMVQINGFALLFVALLVAVDVVSRKVFDLTLAGSDEISGYVLAISSAWAYAYCLLQRGHIRIDLVYARFSLRFRCLFDVIGLLALLIFVSVFSSKALGVLLESMEHGSVSNTPLQTPLWIPQVFWVAGLLFFTVTLIVLCTRSILALVRGDLGTVAKAAGIPSIEEEIAAESRGGA